MSEGENSPVLVTGGCGFVGRHLTRRLLEQGAVVSVVDNLTTGRPPETWLPDEYTGTSQDGHRVFRGGAGTLHFYESDVRQFFREESREYGDVFHLAAVVGGRETIENEPLRVATDLSIDAEFFNWAARVRPERILYASSSAAYPTRLQEEGSAERLREDHIDLEGTIGRPDMTYGWSKLTGEFLARRAASDYGLSVAVVRPFSGYGEDQAFDYPIPAIARRAYLRRDPLTIWGSGEQVRDFVHIEDCVDAMLRCIDVVSDGSGINIGSGRPTTFHEVARTFADLVGYDPEIRTLPEKPEGPAFRCADPSRVESVLNWEPRISLEEGFQRVLAGMSERLETDETRP